MPASRCSRTRARTCGGSSRSQRSAGDDERQDHAGQPVRRHIGLDTRPQTLPLLFEERDEVVAQHRHGPAGADSESCGSSRSGSVSTIFCRSSCSATARWANSQAPLEAVAKSGERRRPPGRGGAKKRPTSQVMTSLDQLVASAREVPVHGGPGRHRPAGPRCPSWSWRSPPARCSRPAASRIRSRGSSGTRSTVGRRLHPLVLDAIAARRGSGVESRRPVPQSAEAHASSTDACHDGGMSTVLLSTDGSDRATAAMVRGVELLGRDHRFTAFTVVSPAFMPSTTRGTDGYPPDGPSIPVLEAEEERAGGRTRPRADLTRLVASARRRRPRRGSRSASPGRRSARRGRGSMPTSWCWALTATAGCNECLLGSVSHHVLHHTPCPVLVITPAAPDARNRARRTRPTPAGGEAADGGDQLSRRADLRGPRDRAAGSARTSCESCRRSHRASSARRQLPGSAAQDQRVPHDGDGREDEPLDGVGEVRPLVELRRRQQAGHASGRRRHLASGAAPRPARGARDLLLEAADVGPGEVREPAGRRVLRAEAARVSVADAAR